MAGETFVKRYPSGYTDSDAAKPVDAQALNAYDAALLRLLGEDPAADEVGVWVPGSGRFVFQKITNAQIDAAAAIDKSKLAALNIVNADIAAGAAIVKSKLAALAIINSDIDAAAAIAISKLAGYPTDSSKVLKGDGTWGAFPGTKVWIGNFSIDNLAASQTNLLLHRILRVDGVLGSLQVGVAMIRAGSVTGISVTGTAARAAGTATFKVYKNGVDTGFSAVIDGTNTQYVAATQASGLDTFVAADRLDVRVTTDAGWSPTTTEFEVLVEVEV